MDNLQRHHGGSAELETSQKLLEQALTAKIPDWVRNGKSITVAKIEPGETLTINHALGRVPQGWMVMSPRMHSGNSTDDPAVVVELSRAANTIKLRLASTAAAAMKFDLWIW